MCHSGHHGTSAAVVTFGAIEEWDERGRERGRLFGHHEMSRLRDRDRLGGGVAFAQRDEIRGGNDAVLATPDDEHPPAIRTPAGEPGGAPLPAPAPPPRDGPHHPH